MYFDTTAPDPAGTFKFYVMNDWTELTLPLSPWEMQLFEIGYDGKTWELTISGFPPGAVTPALNPNDGRWFDGNAGFGQSPNSMTNHAMWEMGISLDNYQPGKQIWVRISDPFVPSGVLLPDPAFKEGFKVRRLPGGGSDSVVVPEPSTLLLLGSGLAGVIVFGRKRLFKKT